MSHSNIFDNTAAGVAVDAGYSAAVHGAPVTRNPYELNSREYMWWSRGWREYQYIVTCDPDEVEEGLLFICPDCGSHELEELTDGLTSALIQLDEHGDYVFIERTDHYGDIDRFQCNHCGFVLAGITDSEDAASWIIENCKEIKDEKG